MDDMISKISELLSDPSQAEKIKQIAASLAGNGESTALSDLSSEISLPDTGKTTSDQSNALGSVLNSSDTRPTNENMSRNIALLKAITPYLRSSRASKISSAIKAIQIIDILSKVR